RVAEEQLSNRASAVEMHRVVGRDIERAKVSNTVGPVGDIGRCSALPITWRGPEPTARRVDPSAVVGQRGRWAGEKYKRCHGQNDRDDPVAVPASRQPRRPRQRFAVETAAPKTRKRPNGDASGTVHAKPH